jgi:hypothetical protein
MPASCTRRPSSGPRHIPRAPRFARLFFILAVFGCAHATVDGDEGENIDGDGDGDEDPMSPSTGGNLSDGTGGLVGSGGQDTGGAVSTGGEWIGAGASSSGGENSGGASTGGTPAGGSDSGGTTSGGSTSGGASSGGSGGGDHGNCDAPDLGAYSQATACGQTVIFGGALYECITMYYQAGDCNHTPGVWRCDDYAPNDAAWGTAAWSKIMDCD